MFFQTKLEVRRVSANPHPQVPCWGPSKSVALDGIETSLSCSWWCSWKWATLSNLLTPVSLTVLRYVWRPVSQLFRDLYSLQQSRRFIRRQFVPETMPSVSYKSRYQKTWNSGHTGHKTWDFGHPGHVSKASPCTVISIIFKSKRILCRRQYGQITIETPLYNFCDCKNLKYFPSKITY